MSTDGTNEIEEAASDWLVRRDSGHWTDADQARFEEWLGASTLHRVAFLRLELAWEESARLKALGAGVPDDQPPPPERWNLTPFFESHRTQSARQTPDPGVLSADVHEAPDIGAVDTELHDVAARVGVSKASPHLTRRFSIAASALLAVAVAVGAHQFWRGTADRYATPVGGLASVPMRDGSKITLNTNSQVGVALTETERRIDLRQGEVFFEVAKDPERPFVVEAGKKRVVAVGTKFSVRREADSIEVVVTEGTVRVEDAAEPLRSNAVQPSRSARSELIDDPVLLTPGAIAFADEVGVLVQRRSLQEAETRLSWRRGVLIFRDQSLADAIAEFNRYNERKIVISDPAVAELKVEGNFRATNVEAFARLLESGFQIRATVEEDRIILSSR